MNYIQALTEPPINRQELSKRIHRAASHLWILKKCLEKVPPYCLHFRRVDVPLLVVRLSREVAALKQKRKDLARPSWYPRRSTANKIKTRIMRECIRKGFNVKQIAGYFNCTLQCVYRRVKIKQIV